MSNPVGPVCHIPPANTPASPQKPSLPGLPGPASADINSVTSTVNQILAMLKALLNQTNQGFQRKPDPNGKGNPGDFHTQDLVTKKVKVYQNNDPETGNFVEVNQVTKLVMGNKAGATWTYNAPPNNNGG